MRTLRSGLLRVLLLSLLLVCLPPLPHDLAAGGGAVSRRSLSKKDRNDRAERRGQQEKDH